jgi:hypothetical protein
LKLNRETVRLVLKNDLQLSAYKKKQIHELKRATVKKRFNLAKILLSWHAGDDRIFFEREDVSPGATTERAK